MKTTVSITGLVVLGALAAFLAGPAGAEDDPPTPPAPTQEAPPRRPHAGPPPAALAARLADTNRDGAVSAEEWKAFTERLSQGFASLDKDGDGALSTAEMPTRPDGPPRGRRAGSRPDDMRGPQQGRRGPPPQGMRGPQQERRGPPADMGARIDKLTTALENLVKQLEADATK